MQMIDTEAPSRARDSGDNRAQATAGSRDRIRLLGRADADVASPRAEESRLAAALCSRWIARPMAGLPGGRGGWSTSSSPREGAMSSAQQLLDTAGRRRSPATLPDFHAGRAPGNKRLRCDGERCE